MKYIRQINSSFNSRLDSSEEWLIWKIDKNRSSTMKYRKEKKKENSKLVEFSSIHRISVSEAEKRKNKNLNTIFLSKTDSNKSTCRLKEH